MTKSCFNNDYHSSSSDMSGISFPVKLYDMLEDAERQGFDHIISWIPNGIGFKVHKSDDFVNHVLPKYFAQQIKYKSFQRQLNMYEFKMLRKTARGTSLELYRGVFFHPFFTRGDRDSAGVILRKTTLKDHGSLIDSSNTDDKNKKTTKKGSDPVTSLFLKLLKRRTLIDAVASNASCNSSPNKVNSSNNKKIIATATTTLPFPPPTPISSNNSCATPPPLTIDESSSGSSFSSRQPSSSSSSVLHAPPLYAWNTNTNTNTRYDERVVLPSSFESGQQGYNGWDIVQPSPSTSVDINPCDIRRFGGDNNMQMMKFGGGGHQQQPAVVASTPDASTTSSSYYNVSSHQHHHQSLIPSVSSTSLVGISTDDDSQNPLLHSSASPRPAAVHDSPSSLWYENHSQCLLDYAMDEVSRNHQEQHQQVDSSLFPADLHNDIISTFGNFVYDTTASSTTTTASNTMIMPSLIVEAIETCCYD